ncbi:BREX-2 system adenine-specific DNA-methyltransferase PglX [Streptomyces solisilvae]|uniref:BREX-2 system adenine-specific DNA-methyltransferase PglX n=1 Tax=Streptomyces malaysiensis TaxID=92644 RepID=UPI00367C2321
MSARGGNQDGLLKDLRKQVSLLEEDLRARSESVEEYRASLDEEYQRARKAERTASTYEAWRDERVTQAAAAWILASVFVRFCEDNGLIEHHWIAGVGNGLREAEERHEEFFRVNPDRNDRDWLIEAFDHLAETNPAVAGLFDKEHNPLWELHPSYEAASGLLKFWRRVDNEGNIVHSFFNPDLDTRFLGDLYQDLSENARKTYALLQTPEFVEEFILDLTLEPAVEEFGLTPTASVHQADGTTYELPQGLRTIDPACGSGHFLLGIFERLLEKWRTVDGEADEWVLIQRALNSVHGCDKNPFAVAIARFRLLVAALKAAEVKRLKTMPAFPINVAVGDSLLHGREASGVRRDLFFDEDEFFYRTEDINTFVARCDLLGRGSYHVVVGNPPYITPKDKAEKKAYWKAYFACSGAYALSVPFAQRIFELAIRGSRNGHTGGYTGQITANSFMKREFGKLLIESYFHGGPYKDWQTKRVRHFSGVELTHIIDTSGAYIPGHGTPTVILAGRNRIANQENKIRTVLGIRGEPTQPKVAEEGLVWKAITDQVDKPGSESEWVSVAESSRQSWANNPWSLTGGGSGDVFDHIEKQNSQRLGNVSSLIGRTAHTGQDESYFAPPGTWPRLGVAPHRFVPLVEGNAIRDWEINPITEALFPYSNAMKAELGDGSAARRLWLHRTTLRGRREPGGTHEEIGLTWYEWSRWHPERFSVPLGIAFPFVSTHNHFALDHGGKVFNRTAPVIKFPKEVSEDKYLALLGVLNSSVACFWLKQVSQDKGNRGGERSTGRYAWESFYEFTGTKLQDFPLPADLPLSLGHALDTLARRLVSQEPSAVCVADTTPPETTEPTPAPTRVRLDAARTAWTETRERMIALQEELDWEVYHAYGLLTDAEKARLTVPNPTDPDNPNMVPRVRLGERAFEIAMAREIASGGRDFEAQTAWFQRHRSTPVTEIPDHWPDWYQEIVQARIDIIEARRDIALIERPECKRRWATDPWEKKEKSALRAWLLDRCEERELWFHLRDGLEQPRTLTIGQLADELTRQPDADDIATVADLYAAHLGKPNLTLEQVLLDATDAEHVPYLAAYRYKDSGLRKRAQWEEVWDLQREEDKDGERRDIPIPPKYTSADFAKASYWSNRGKLDVPKERFISYPDANPDSDPTLLLGWAGWDHRDQALALLNVVEDRRKRFDWQADKLAPLLAGLAELMPWLRQWFGEVDEEWGEESAADEIGGFLDGELARLELSPADLAGWRPAKKGRGRKAAAKAIQPVLGTDDGAHSGTGTDGNGEDEQ